MSDQQVVKQDSFNPLGLNPRDYPVCSYCRRRMLVRQLMPSITVLDADEVVYGCVDCGTAALRTVRR